MLDDAIEYPWRSEQKVGTLLIGGFLSVLYFFIIPGILLHGYQIKILRQVCAGDTEAAPAFGNWGQLLVDGLVGGVIMLVYGVLFMTPFGVSVVVLLPFAAESAGGGAIAMAGAVVAVLLSLVAFAVGFALIYLFPAALAAYAVTGEFTAAFSPSTLRTVGSDTRYLKGVVVAVVINFIAQTAANFIVITIVGILLIPFILFYGTVASTYALGTGVGETPVVDAHRDRESSTGQTGY